MLKSVKKLGLVVVGVGRYLLVDVEMFVPRRTVVGLRGSIHRPVGLTLGVGVWSYDGYSS